MALLKPEFLVEHIQWLLPTWLLRLVVRLYLRFLAGPDLRKPDVVCRQIRCDTQERDRQPVTVMTKEANEQHYGNDPAFFEAHLGPKLKYSACEFPTENCTLAEAEDITVRVYQEKAGLPQLAPGSRVLELGCGWGSLSLTNAARFPKLKFVSFSNSPQQCEWNRAQAKKRDLTNIEFHVEDYALFVQKDKSKIPAGPYDAAFAIETIEHCRNIHDLLQAVGQRLKPGAKLFAQSILHQSASYMLDDSSWMGRQFFSGGSILALNSYCHLTPRNLRLNEVVPVNGIGYSKTLLAWLIQLEEKKGEFLAKYGRKFYEGFRAFYYVCVEAFAANDGAEYMIGYYTWEKL